MKLTMPFNVSLICALLLSLTASAQDKSTSISFSKDIVPLLITPTANNKRSCTECHKPKGPNAYLITLGDPKSVDYNSLFMNGEKTIIVKGDPDQSLLCQKLKKDFPDWVAGERMPHRGPAYFEDSDISKICDWIREGALNN